MSIGLYSNFPVGCAARPVTHSCVRVPFCALNPGLDVWKHDPDHQQHASGNYRRTYQPC
jgi:hypothetical protein